MRVFDLVARRVDPLLVSANGRRFELPSAAGLAGEVESAPLRYVLDDAVAECATMLAFTQAEQVLKAAELIRWPAPKVWVEWSDAARTGVLRAAGYGPADSVRRVGCLITTDESGVRGTIETVWIGETGEPDLAQVSTEFDYGGLARSSETVSPWVAAYPALDALMQCSRFRLRPAWGEYYRRVSANGEQMARLVNANCEMVGADFPFLTAFALLLTARHALNLERTDLGQLNRARQRHGRPTLLDFVNVTANVEGEAGRARQDNGVLGASRRRHFVSGHLVRRGDLIFWRRPHLRGDAGFGIVRARNITLRLRTDRRAR